MSGYDDRQVVQKYVVEKGFALISKPFTLQKPRGFRESVLDGNPQVEPARLRDHAETSPAPGSSRDMCRASVSAGSYASAPPNLGLSGWVRNEDDGRVQVYAIGTPDQLNRLAAWLHQGPRTADVRGVEEHEAAVQQLSSFQSR